MTPWLTSTTATTNASGSRTRTTPRTRSTQKLPIVADAAPGQAADQGDRHGQADGGRHEVLHRQARHLGEVAHRDLAARSSASSCWSRS